MTEQRIIIEMGTGNDQYGMNYTKAAMRAIEDAIRHSSLPIFDRLQIDHDLMRVQVTVGVQNPSKVKVDKLAQKLPRGRVEIRAVHGGLDAAHPETGNTIVVATAAVEAFLPSQKGWSVCG